VTGTAVKYLFFLFGVRAMPGWRGSLQHIQTCEERYVMVGLVKQVARYHVPDVVQQDFEWINK